MTLVGSVHRVGEKEYRAVQNSTFVRHGVAAATRGEGIRCRDFTRRGSIIEIKSEGSMANASVYSSVEASSQEEGEGLD
jgi:hypothetical protein